MSSKSWLVWVLLSPLGAPEAAYAAPLPPSQSSPKPDAPVNPKAPPESPEGAPDSGLAGPPNGLLFEYLTPMDFAVKDATVLYPEADPNVGNGVVLRFISNWRDKDSNIVYKGQANARVKLPRGARIRWLDCAIQSPVASSVQPIAGYPIAELEVTATLSHARHTDHPKTTPPLVLATVKLKRKINEGDDVLGFARGAAVDHPRGTVSDDGWHYVSVQLKQTKYAYGSLGLRACRVGYTP